MMYLTEVLCTIFTALTQELVMGTLPIPSITNDAIKSELEVLRNPKNQTPGVYSIYLVDGNGFGPPWAAWKSVLRALEVYGSIGDEADDHASRFDTMHHTRKKNLRFDNRRKYLLTDGDAKRKISHGRRVGTIY
ncbi:hypothetical protein VF21_07754 [Pseudogymnoascus sp. 05NY08]|nr:hypothetical protein VF21_07754 [Pseudogymnoascus sp. 05NY08]